MRRHFNPEASSSAQQRRPLGKDRRLSVQTSFSALHEPTQLSSLSSGISSIRQNAFAYCLYLKKARSATAPYVHGTVVRQIDGIFTAQLNCPHTSTASLCRHHRRPPDLHPRPEPESANNNSPKRNWRRRCSGCWPRPGGPSRSVCRPSSLVGLLRLARA